MKIIITYLIRVFDTTWESKFWVLNSYFFTNFLFFHVILKVIKAFGPVKKVSVLYRLKFTVFARRRVKVDAVVSVKW